MAGWPARSFVRALPPPGFVGLAAHDVVLATGGPAGSRNVPSLLRRLAASEEQKKGVFFLGARYSFRYVIDAAAGNDDVREDKASNEAVLSFHCNERSLHESERASRAATNSEAEARGNV